MGMLNAYNRRRSQLVNATLYFYIKRSDHWVS